LVSPYNKKNITRWLEDMNFMFLPLEHGIHVFSPPCNIFYIHVEINNISLGMFPQKLHLMKKLTVFNF